MSRRSAAFVLGFLAVAGCSAGGAGVGGNGGTGGNGALSMAVDAVTLPAAIGGVQPASGRHFVEVTASLTNGSGNAESIAFALFAVQTASGLRVQAAAATAQLVHACAADQSLAPGGTTMCSLAFEVPTAEMATMLVWLDPRTMATSTAALPQPSVPTFESVCEAAYALKNPTSSSCSHCVQTSCTTPNACTSSDLGCADGCVRADMGSACGCIAQCPLSSDCKQQMLDYMQCETTTCATECS